MDQSAEFALSAEFSFCDSLHETVEQFKRTKNGHICHFINIFEEEKMSWSNEKYAKMRNYCNL